MLAVIKCFVKGNKGGSYGRPWSKKDHEPAYTNSHTLLDETEHSRAKVLHVELVRFADELGRRVDVGETTYYLRYGFNCLQMKPGYYAISTIKKAGLFGWSVRLRGLKYGRKSGEFQMPRGGIMVARKPAVCLGTLCFRFKGLHLGGYKHTQASPKFFDVTRHFEIKSMLLQTFQQKKTGSLLRFQRENSFLWAVRIKQNNISG